MKRYKRLEENDFFNYSEPLPKKIQILEDHLLTRKNFDDLSMRRLLIIALSEKFKIPIAPYGSFNDTKIMFYWKVEKLPWIGSSVLKDKDMTKNIKLFLKNINKKINLIVDPDNYGRGQIIFK